MKIEYRQLGTTDLQVSSIGLGCVTFGREIDEPTSLAILDRAVDRGINLLDTAAVYGEGASEEILGRWMRLRATRDRVVLATKVSGLLTRDRVITSAEASLRRLATDRIDLLQAHDWDEQTPLEETLEAFERLVERGLVRYCGCSNWDVTQLDRARSLATERNWRPLVSIQPIYNLVDRHIEDGLLEFCSSQRVGVISYSPLGAGFLTGKYRRGGSVPTGTRFDVKPAHQDIYFTDRGFQVMESLRSLAEVAGLSMARLALAWVLRRQQITSVLIGARTPQHVDQAFEALRSAHSPDLKELLDRLCCTGGET
jgi:aryl-alcohol dehydrogenase-like predicted oxidoreductase